MCQNIVTISALLVCLYNFMKIHNVFIAAFGTEIQYYTALVRPLCNRPLPCNSQL